LRRGDPPADEVVRIYRGIRIVCSWMPSRQLHRSYLPKYQKEFVSVVAPNQVYWRAVRFIDNQLPKDQDPGEKLCRDWLQSRAWR